MLILLFIFSAVILGVSIWIFVIVLKEQSKGKKEMEILENNRKEIDALFNKAFPDYETE